MAEAVLAPLTRTVYDHRQGHGRLIDQSIDGSLRGCVMERTVSASHARVRLGELLRVVAEQDEAILIERSGTPQAVLISIAAYERLKERSDPWAVAWEKVQRARELARLEGGGRPLHPTPEDVLRQLREERDEQLLSGLPGFESCRPLGDGTEQ